MGTWCPPLFRFAAGVGHPPSSGVAAALHTRPRGGSIVHPFDWPRLTAAEQDEGYCQWIQRQTARLETDVEIRVFLIEDLKSTQSLMDELFSSLGGFRIVSAVATEAEAILWLDENPTGWDLAVIDLVIEQGTGMGLIARAKSLPTAGTVLVFSSYASPGVRKHCLRLGADAVFDKSEPSEFIRYCVALTARENSGL